MHILLIDDHLLFASSLAIALKKYETQVSTSLNFNQARTYLKLYCPDIVLINAQIRQEDSMEIAANLLDKYPKQKVVFLSGINSFGYVKKAATMGAYGFLNKSISITEIVDKLEMVHSGNKIFSSQATDDTKDLTTREQEILQLAALGYKHHEIADYLQISRRTVTNHFHSITEKFDVHSTIAAVVKGIDLGYISTKSPH